MRELAWQPATFGFGHAEADCKGLCSYATASAFGVSGRNKPRRIKNKKSQVNLARRRGRRFFVGDISRLDATAAGNRVRERTNNGEKGDSETRGREGRGKGRLEP